VADRNLTTKKLYGQFMTREGMALIIPPDDNFSLNSIPQTIDFSVTDNPQKFPEGTKLIYADREFRYYKNDGTVDIAGNLYQGALTISGHIGRALDTPAAGTTTVGFTPTSTNITLDQYTNGYFFVTTANADGGYLGRIKSCPAVTAGSEGDIVLYDPLPIVIAGASTGTLLASPWHLPIIHSSPPTAPVCGWAQAATVASQWGWLGYHGPMSALIDGTVVIGNALRPSEDDDGAVALLDFDEADDANHGQVGLCMAVGADQTFGAIWAML
jgi:hypothetical protein